MSRIKIIIGNMICSTFHDDTAGYDLAQLHQNLHIRRNCRLITDFVAGDLLQVLLLVLYGRVTWPTCSGGVGVMVSVFNKSCELHKCIEPVWDMFIIIFDSFIRIIADTQLNIMFKSKMVDYHQSMSRADPHTHTHTHTHTHIYIYIYINSIFLTILNFKLLQFLSVTFMWIITAWNSTFWGEFLLF